MKQAVGSTLMKKKNYKEALLPIQKKSNIACSAIVEDQPSIEQILCSKQNGFIVKNGSFYRCSCQLHKYAMKRRNFQINCLLF